MIRIELKDSNGLVILDTTFPSTAAELKLSNYVSFMSEASKMGQGNEIEIMAKAVAEFTGSEFDTILKANFHDAWKTSQGALSSVKSIYAKCIEVVSDWKGQDREEHTFEWKGDLYSIPRSVADGIAGNPLPGISTNEAIEVFEVIRTYGGMITAGATIREACYGLTHNPTEEESDAYMNRIRAIVPAAKSMDLTKEEVLDKIFDEHGDKDGNMLYSRYLMLMAILCRKPGEKLPTKEAAKRKFIAERAVLFQDIDTQTALDTDFFLLNSLATSKTMHPVIGSLIRLSFGVVVEMISTNAKHMPELRHIIKKSMSA